MAICFPIFHLLELHNFFCYLVKKGHCQRLSLYFDPDGWYLHFHLYGLSQCYATSKDERKDVQTGVLGLIIRSTALAFRIAREMRKIERRDRIITD